MSLYPDVQRKAQEELDRVVGPNRLPDFEDYHELLYIKAVLLEAMRWMVVVPLSLPHRVIRDDEYKGYIIPEGTIVNPVSHPFISLYVQRITLTFRRIYGLYIMTLLECLH